MKIKKFKNIFVQGFIFIILFFIIISCKKLENQNSIVKLKKVEDNIQNIKINKESNLLISGSIPIFSFEEEMQLRIKLFNMDTKKNNTDSIVIFQISPSVSPPPYGHDLEMEYCIEYLSGNTKKTEIINYIEYLKNMKINYDKSIYKFADFNKATGYYESNFFLPRFPYAIKVYVVEKNGKMHVPDYFFPHRAHCEYFDVTNIELIKTYLHQINYFVKYDNWEDATKKMEAVIESLKGKHGMYYMLKEHHGKSIDTLIESVQYVKKNIDEHNKKNIDESINKLFIEVQKGENYFGEITVISNNINGKSRIKIWDNINMKPVLGAFVIIQNNYDPIIEAQNPVIVSFNKPNENIYHAKISYIPKGIMANEIGNGIYEVSGVDFNLLEPKRIFVYYVINKPSIISKFITKELNIYKDEK